MARRRVSKVMHATEDHVPPKQYNGPALCSRWAVGNVDNAHPTCKVCLRIIAKRIRETGNGTGQWPLGPGPGTK